MIEIKKVQEAKNLTKMWNEIHDSDVIITELRLAREEAERRRKIESAEQFMKNFNTSDGFCPQ